jgi:hypothetical protein
LTFIAGAEGLLSQFGSVTVLGQEPEAHGGLSPHSFQVRSHLGNALIVQPVEPTSTFGSIVDQPRPFQQPEVSRYGRTTNRQLIRELLHGLIARAQ